MISENVKRNFWMLESVIILFVLLGIAFGKWSAWFGQYGWLASMLLVISSLFGGMVIGIAAHRVGIIHIDSSEIAALTLDRAKIEASLSETRELYKTICIGIVNLSINRVANKIVAKYAPEMSKEDVRRAVLKTIDEIVCEEMCGARQIFEEQLNKSAKPSQNLS